MYVYAIIVKNLVKKCGEFPHIKDFGDWVNTKLFTAKLFI